LTNYLISLINGHLVTNYLIAAQVGTRRIVTLSLSAQVISLIGGQQVINYVNSGTGGHQVTIATCTVSSTDRPESTND
jgi:hypothetical protein